MCSGNFEDQVGGQKYHIWHVENLIIFLILFANMSDDTELMW